MYIGLISDTHGFFDSPLMDFLKPVDEIWHAGDFGGLETARKIAAVPAVRLLRDEGAHDTHRRISRPL